MTDLNWIDLERTEIGTLRVDQMFPRPSAVDQLIDIETFSYTLVFVSASDADIRRLVAREIRILADLEIDLDDMDGSAFIAGILQSAAEHEIPVVPSPPEIEADLTLVSYLTGGIDILLGSPTPWDPNLFCLRFEGEHK